MARCFRCETLHNFLVKVVFTINTSSMRSVEERLFCPLCFKKEMGWPANEKASEVAGNIVDNTIGELVVHFPELNGKINKYSPAMLELHRRLTKTLESEVNRDG